MPHGETEAQCNEGGRPALPEGGLRLVLSAAPLISALVTLLRPDLVLSLIPKQSPLLESVWAAERCHGLGLPYQTLILTVLEDGSPRSGCQPSGCVSRTLPGPRWLSSCCVTHGGKQREDALSQEASHWGLHLNILILGRTHVQSITAAF